MRCVFGIKKLLKINIDKKGTWAEVKIFDNTIIRTMVHGLFDKINIEYFKNNLDKFVVVQYYIIVNDDYNLEYQGILEEKLL